MSRYNVGGLFILLTAALFFGAESAYAQESEVSTQTAGQASVKQEYAENYVFADPKQRKLFLELTAELRCPKCQNQNIADSDAPIAHDMRRKVYELMQQGNDKPDVINWMKQRYGDFVYYQPPVNSVTIWLWLLPILFSIGMAVMFFRRRKTADNSNIDAKLAEADKLLKED
ncbi:MAG: cytochrome c-type biogenesis protein [Glaciecola sp.]